MTVLLYSSLNDMTVYAASFWSWENMSMSWCKCWSIAVVLLEMLKQINNSNIMLFASLDFTASFANHSLLESDLMAARFFLLTLICVLKIEVTLVISVPNHPVPTFKFD